MNDPKQLELFPNTEDGFVTNTWGIPLIANRDKFEALVGFDVHPEVFEYAPWGRRLVVVREKPLEMYEGRIVIPDTAKEMPTCGWVVSVGNSVGELPYPGRIGGCPLHRERLLGCKVLFGQYVGEAFLVGDKDETQFSSRYSILDEESVKGTVGPPPTEGLL